MASASLSEQLDPALLDLFRAEADTHVPVLSEGLLALEKDPTQTKQLDGLMRAAHSIKGAARIIGLEPAVQLAHVLEDCMVAAQAGRIALNGDAIDVLLRGVDLLGRIAQEIAVEPPVGLGALVAEMKVVAAGQQPAPAAPPPPSLPAPLPAVSSTILARPGLLDAVAAEALRQAVLQRFERGDRHLEFDFNAVTDLEPVGLTLLTAVAQVAAGRDASVLEISHANPEVLTLLCLTGLDRSYRLNAGGAPLLPGTAPCKANA